MKKLSLVLVFVLAITVAAFSGCASPSGQSVGQATKMRVAQIPMGSTQQQVVSILGNPQDTTSRITPEGNQQVFAYRLGVLIEKIEGGGAAFGYGMQQGLAGNSGSRPILLTFTNGKLAAIEGL